MSRSRWVWGVELLGLSALAVSACTDSTDTPALDQVAGQNATATAGQGPGAGGDGNATGGVGGANAGTCPERTLKAYCQSLEQRVVPQACPTGPADFDLGKSCGPYNGVDRYASDCGGVVVKVWGDKKNGVDYYEAEFSFAPNGTLVGITYGSDYVPECPDVWGAPCATIGAAEALCNTGGAGGAGGQSASTP